MVLLTQFKKASINSFYRRGVVIERRLSEYNTNICIFKEHFGIKYTPCSTINLKNVYKLLWTFASDPSFQK